MVFLAVAVAFLGIPHGATDHLVGDFLCRPACPRAWLIPFAAVLPPPCVPYELI